MDRYLSSQPAGSVPTVQSAMYCASHPCSTSATWLGLGLGLGIGLGLGFGLGIGLAPTLILTLTLTCSGGEDGDCSGVCWFTSGTCDGGKSGGGKSGAWTEG